MNKRSVLTCLLSVFLLFITSLHSRAQQPDSLLAVLDKNYPQERIYVQYDRPYYNPGETIWMKAYLFAGQLPSSISKTMYAELIDEKGQVLQRKTLPVLGASAATDFALPDSLHASLLYIRAYTPWMLNFDSAFLYLKPIRIIQPATKADKTKKESLYYLNFFPEGGDMVNELESKIAFMATDDQGFPIRVRGDITTSKGQIIISFADIHDGMGTFLLQPHTGETYKAIWKDPKGGTHETALPAARPEGILLSVTNIGDKVSYNLLRSDSFPVNQRSFQVLAQMQQQIVYMARINMTNKTWVTAPIPSENLPDGIMQVTLFTAGGQPVAERILFINHGSYYFITDVHANEKNLTKKAKNVLQVDVGDTLTANLSIAVTDAGTVTTSREEENIFSHILLTSDIKGYIYNPAYYFSSREDSVQAHLDLVMLTHGWRRFKWDDIVAGRWPAIKNVPEQYITVKGQVLGLSSSEMTGKELSMILQTKKKNSQFMMVPVSNKGEFIVNNMLFYDTAKLYYQFNNDKSKRLTSTASFDFKNSFINLPGKPVTNLHPLLKPVLPDSTSQKKNELLTKSRKADFFEGNEVKELAGVEVKAKQKTLQQKMNEEYTSGFFTSDDGYTFITADDPFAKSAMSVLDYLQGKVAGLQITNTGPDGGSLSWRGGTPSLFVNEMNADVSLIQSTPMSDVAMIKVFRPPFFGAMGGGSGGAIAVYTKKGELANSSVQGLNFTQVAGYTAPREFFSPDYSKDADKNKADFRTTLYWNPFLVFDKNTRRILIPFYNNDNCKKIRVVIEGVNEEGKLTREEKFFE